jgi:hypothetical protein
VVLKIEIVNTKECWFSGLYIAYRKMYFFGFGGFRYGVTSSSKSSRLVRKKFENSLFGIGSFIARLMARTLAGSWLARRLACWLV